MLAAQVDFRGDNGELLVESRERLQAFDPAGESSSGSGGGVEDGDAINAGAWDGRGSVDGGEAAHGGGPLFARLIGDDEELFGRKRSHRFLTSF